MSPVMKLEDLVIALRSKNAGPCQLTLDLMFADAEAMARVSAHLPRILSEIAQRYGVPEQDVRAHVFPPALAIKFTLPRRLISGEVGDSDVYGAQQHGPLLELEI